MSFTSITRVANRVALKAQKNSPQILFGAGVVGSVATVVVACRATLKAQRVNEIRNQTIAQADIHLERNNYDETVHKAAVVNAWKNSSIDYIKLYGPAVALGVGSIACLTKSHQILTNRNVALTAAYTGLDKAYKSYRGRVVQELGEQKDMEFAFGAVDKEVVDYDKDGNPVVSRVRKIDPEAQHVYARWFDEGNRFWDKDTGYNHTFLDNQQKWANLQLKTKGHLFLNEVYDMIGIPRSQEGQLAGWVYDTDEGDGYVDFGFNKFPDFVAGYERSVWLDFNVDGPILGMI